MFSDIEKAYQLLMKSANNGFVGGLRYLADYYRQGIYVQQDINQAIELYIQAANQGDEYSAEWLNELGVKENQ